MREFRFYGSAAKRDISKLPYNQVLGKGLFPDITLISDAYAAKDLKWNGRKQPASLINDV